MLMIASLLLLLLLYSTVAFSFHRTGSSPSKTTINMSVARKQSRAIPKEETKIYDLFDNYPNSDGRGIKIAILDTGCDLNAAGLNGTTRYVHSQNHIKNSYHSM